MFFKKSKAVIGIESHKSQFLPVSHVFQVEECDDLENLSKVSILTGKSCFSRKDWNELQQIVTESQFLPVSHVFQG